VKDKFTETFITRTRDEWADIFNGTDACVTPILAFDEVMDNCHNQERKTLVNIDGILQPAPAPRLSRTPGKVGNLVQKPEGNTRELLQELGLSEKEILDLRNIGVVE
jgi:alpha-methylacyl-CoA racemase